MSRHVVSLTLDTLPLIPKPCRSCVVWELDPVAAKQAEKSGDTGFEKEAWVSATLLEWGSCGRIVIVDDEPAGYLMYAPPHLVPHSLSFATAPVSADAVLLMTGRVLPRYSGQGLARMLVQSAAKDMARRSIRALEAFGAQPTTPLVEPGKWGHTCVLPADLLLAVGFKTVRPHHRYPRLRLDLKSTVSWREDVELALERIFISVRQPALASHSEA